MDALLPYCAMAYNNTWATIACLTACARLSQADFEAPRTGFFPSLRATLNHILVIDRFYLGRVRRAGTSDPPPGRTRSRAERLSVFRPAQAEVDRPVARLVEPP